MDSTPFSPAYENLVAIKDEIEESLQIYRSCESENERSEALRALAQSSRRLASAASDPRDAYLDFTFQPLGNACVRASLAIGLFDHLSDREARTAHDLAERTKSDAKLVTRLLRILSSLSLVQEDVDGQYLHTALSKAYTEKSQRAYTVLMFDLMAHVGTSIGPFFEEGKYKAGSGYTPFCFAFGETESKDTFQVMQEIGKSHILVEGMSGSGPLFAKEAAATYPFDQLTAEDGGVVLVDVGGNRGETLREIQRAHPNLKGRMVLQDLSFVLERGAVSGLDAELQSHDFFKETQPVKGAAAYFLQRIFHDWAFDDCRKILRSLKPAMGPDSRLLISEVVLEDHRPNSRKALRDMNMLLIGGMERSEADWTELLGSEGFSISRVFGRQNSNHSIVEAVVDNAK